MSAAGASDGVGGAGGGVGGGVDRAGRLLLALAAVAVAFAAADTYVVVLALPEMMASAGLSAEDLQRAAPVVSGFLLGYVAVLPLVGRIADLRGRLPVLVGSLVLFALGSLVTAASYDLSSMVAGRVLQGVGGGLLTPVGLAMLFRAFPPERRAAASRILIIPTAVAPALGPVLGVLLIEVASWRWVFAGEVLIVVVIPLLFGAKKLPDMARSLGKSARILKSEAKAMKKDGGEQNAQSDAAAPDVGTLLAAELGLSSDEVDAQVADYRRMLAEERAANRAATDAEVASDPVPEIDSPRLTEETRLA